MNVKVILVGHDLPRLRNFFNLPISDYVYKNTLFMLKIKYQNLGIKTI